MAHACPQCGESSQVLHLAEFWKSLPQDAELKASLAQPAPYDARYVVSLVLGAVAVLCLTAGSAAPVVLGVALLLAAVASVAWFWRAAAEREAAREAWLRLLYCRRCPNQFAPEKALAA